jgi:glycosyltransferase involved in cell wall biosynthesis
MVDSVGEHRGMHYYNFGLVSALNRIGADVVLISTPETVGHFLRPANVPVRNGFREIYGSKPKWVRGLWYVCSLWRIGWWAWQDRPKIVHFHFYQIPLLDLILLFWLRVLNIKTITTVHDVLPFTLNADVASEQGKVYHRLYASSSALIVHSKHAKASLSQLDSKLLDKSVLIGQGSYSDMAVRSTLASEDAKRKIGLEASTPVILVFGTIKSNKRLDLVTEAMVKVCQTYPQSRLIIAGKPQEQSVSEYMELAQQLGVASNVLWRLEHITDEEMMWYFSAADVVVFPYQRIYQSAALVMAMSFAKPIVATAVGSNIEIIKNHKTGILVPLDDPNSMAEAIKTLLEDKEYAVGMGKAAYEYVTTNLSWEGIAETTASFYKRVLTQTENGCTT